MNPNTHFSGQQPGAFQASSDGSAGVFPVQPSFQCSQASPFGQNSGGLLKNPGFINQSDFTMISGLHGPLGFGQPPGFKQPYSQGQATSLVTSAVTNSSVPNKQVFSFKSPTPLGTCQNPSFGAISGETSNSSFVTPDFNFKTPENAVFKPIFLTGSEQEKPANPPLQASFTFSSPGSSGPKSLASFVISQASSSSVSTSFVFSKPVSSSTLPSSSNTSLPSSTAEDKNKTAVLFGNPNTNFASFSNSPVGDSFQMSKTNKPDCEQLSVSSELLPTLGKGTKRKEEQGHSPRHDYDSIDELEFLSRGDPSSNKRPVRLNRPPTRGLFNRTLQDVLKSNKKESKMERVSIESGELEEINVAGGSQSTFPKPISSAAVRKEESKQKEDSSVSKLLPRKQSSGSTESLGGMPSNELTAIQCKNIPDFLNDRNVLENHFKKFVKIQRIRTNRNKKLAIIQCYDHASAVLARKKAKNLHKEIVTFWHKKKPSPSKKDYLSKGEKPDESDKRQSIDQLSNQHSPHCKTTIRSTGSKSSVADKKVLQ